MTRRLLLGGTVGALVLWGVAFSALQFIQSLAPSEGTKNDGWVEYDLAGMNPGEVRSLGPVWVLRRTEQDKALIETYVAALDDPESSRSRQPDQLRNKWRSDSEDYFLFRPAAPRRGCSIAYEAAGSFRYTNVPERDLAVQVSHFTEPCDGRIFDASGRVFRRAGNPQEFNLTVPTAKWLTPTKVQIWTRPGPPLS